MQRDVSFQVRQPQVVYDFFEDEAVILDLESGSYFSARGSAFQIWHWIVDGFSLAQMLESVRLEDRSGVEAYVAQLLQENLIYPNLPAPPRPLPSQPLTLVDIHLEKSTDLQELLTLDPIHDVDESGWPRAATLPR